MKYLILLLVLSAGLMGCDKINKLDEALNDVGQMSDTTGNMDRKMQELNETTRLQKMGIAKDCMNEDYALENLYPVPTGLNACAKIFAEAANAEDLTLYVFNLLKQIDEIYPLKTFGPDGQETEYSTEQQNKILLHKYRDFQSAMAISGFIPDGTVQAVIDRENNDGAYRPTMLKILMLRALFIRQVLVQNQFLDKGKFETIGQAEEAAKYMKKVEFILRLPFAGELEIKTLGLQGPEGYNGPIANADLKMDADTLTFLNSGWETIADLAENALEVNPHAGGVNEAARAARQKAVVNEARRYANGWKEAQP